MKKWPAEKFAAKRKALELEAKRAPSSPAEPRAKAPGSSALSLRASAVEVEKPPRVVRLPRAVPATRADAETVVCLVCKKPSKEIVCRACKKSVKKTANAVLTLANLFR